MICIVLSQVFRQVVLLSLLGSVLAVALLLIKFIFREKLSARFHFLIWLLLLLRLVVFVVPVSPIRLFSPPADRPQTVSIAAAAAEAPGAAAVPDGTAYVHNPAADAGPAAPSRSIDYKVASYIWLAGFAAFLLYLLLANLRLRLRLKRFAVCDREDVLSVLDACRLKLRIKTDVAVLFDFESNSPSICGLLRPRILISPDMIDRLSQEELSYIFLHELSHLRRKDLLIRILCLFLQAVYWFNPVILYAMFKMRQDSEIACDAEVLSILGVENNKKYGKTIIKMMLFLTEPHTLTGTLGFASRYHTRRITMISRFKKASGIATALALALCLLAGCGSIGDPTASSVVTGSPAAAADAGVSQSPAEPSPSVTPAHTEPQNTPSPSPAERPSGTPAQTAAPAPALTAAPSQTAAPAPSLSGTQPAPVPQLMPGKPEYTKSKIQSALKAYGQSVYDITWSPDNSMTVYIKDEKQISNIYVWKVGQSEANLISPAESTTSGFSWSPDGKHFLINVGHMGPGTITSTIVNAESLKILGAVISTVSVSAPVWSPDGKYLALSSDNEETGAIELYIYSIGDNSTQSLLKSTNTYGPYRVKSWSKNGTIVYTETTSTGDQVEKILKAPV